jgi:hypothetical protein
LWERWRGKEEGSSRGRSLGRRAAGGAVGEGAMGHGSCCCVVSVLCACRKEAGGRRKERKKEKEGKEREKNLEIFPNLENI